MDVSKALVERKSVRAYLDKNVELEKIEKILNFAKHAPSGTNTQPWEVSIVSGQSKLDLDAALIEAFRSGATKDLDYKYYPDTISSTLNARRVACGLQMYSTLGIERQDKEKRLAQWELNYSAFGAPVVLYIFLPNSIEKGSFLDCGMFVQSIMLMAVELGLSTCPQAALAEYPKLVREKLGVSNDMTLVCGIALGYEDESALVNSYRTPREDISVFTKFYN